MRVPFDLLRCCIGLPSPQDPEPNRAESDAAMPEPAEPGLGALFQPQQHAPRRPSVPREAPEDAWQGALRELHGMWLDFVHLLPRIAIGACVFAALYFVGKLVRKTVHRGLAHRRHGRRVGLVFGRLAQGLGFLLGLFVGSIVAFPSFTPQTLFQLLGISSVAFGFAFRDVLQNYLAGVLLLLTQPFEPEDQIVFKGFEGTVEDIQTRATFLRTYDGRRVVIPNAELFTQAVTVNTAFSVRRLEYDVGVGYEVDPEAVKPLLLAAMRGCPTVLAEPAPEVLTYELGPSTYAMRVRWWVTPPRRRDVLEARDEVIGAILKQLAAHGIDLPTTQHVRVQTDEASGDGEVHARPARS